MKEISLNEIPNVHSDPSDAVITVHDLSMAYRDDPVLLDINLSIKEGSRTALLGPNGAGKSTLLKGILGLKEPLTGEIRIFGKKIDEVRKRLAYVPQKSSVNWNFPADVEDVVLMGRYSKRGFFKKLKKEDKEKAEAALTLMKMQDFLKRQISELSGGQKQRVFMARAIVQEADIYLLDEPFSGVDRLTEKVIVDFLFALQKDGKTSVVVHHDLSKVEDYFDRVVIINRFLLASGSAKEAFNAENLLAAGLSGDRHG